MKREAPNLQLEMFMNHRVPLRGTGKLQGYKETDNREQIGKDRDRGKQREQNIRTKIKEMRENRWVSRKASRKWEEINQCFQKYTTEHESFYWYEYFFLMKRWILLDKI